MNKMNRYFWKKINNNYIYKHAWEDLDGSYYCEDIFILTPDKLNRLLDLILSEYERG